MKFLRYGDRGEERSGNLNAERQIRDLYSESEAMAGCVPLDHLLLDRGQIDV